MAAISWRCQQATAAEEAASHPYLAATVGAEMGEEQLREMRSSYYGLITECDENLGRVFEALERSGQHDNTVIVFTTVLIPQHRIDAWRCGLPGLLSDACVLMAGSRGAAGGPPPLRDFPPLPLSCRPPLCPAAATASWSPCVHLRLRRGAGVPGQDGLLRAVVPHPVHHRRPSACRRRLSGIRRRGVLRVSVPRV